MKAPIGGQRATKQQTTTKHQAKFEQFFTTDEVEMNWQGMMNRTSDMKLILVVLFIFHLTV